MKKWIALIVAAMMTLSLAGCRQEAQVGPVGVTEKKVAVIRNLSNDDHTVQYLNGIKDEAEPLGYTVETFTTDGDDAVFRQTFETVLEGDYVGVILSHAKESYARDMVARAAEQGLAVVTFDTVFEPLDGVTATFQDDAALAKLSLDYIVQHSARRPARVIKVWYDETMAPFQRRNVVYRDYEARGLIETVAEVYPDVPTSELVEATRTEMNALTDVQADYVWAAWDELAKGVYASECTAPMVSIDVSNEDIRAMLATPERWQATAAVNAAMIGRVNMRLIDRKLSGEETPALVNLEAALVEANVLTAASTVDNLDLYVEDFGESDEFVSDRMEHLKEASQKHVSYFCEENMMADNSYNQLIYNGINALQERAQVEFADYESIEDAAEELEELVEDEGGLIWISELALGDAVVEQASRNSNAAFAVLDLQKDELPDNVLSVCFNNREVAFLAGYIAARQSESGTVGIVGGAQNSAIGDFVTGFENGARYADAEVVVLHDYVGNFSDTARAEELARGMYASGVDVLFHAAGHAGEGVIAAAQKTGRYVIGVDLDQSYLAPENVLTSVTKNVDAVVHSISLQYLENSWSGGRTVVYGLAEDAIALAPRASALPEEIYRDAQAVMKQIASGNLTV